MILLSLFLACHHVDGGDTLQPIEDTGEAGETADSGSGGDDTATDPIYDLTADEIPQGADPCREAFVGLVSEIVDGDTFWEHGPDGAEKIRIIGVDTPEIAHSSDETDECYGPEATTFAEDTLYDNHVWLSFDGDCEDDYGRTLAYVTTGPGDQGFFERQLLRNGYAVTMTFSATSTYADVFEEDERAAQEEGAGMWTACR